MPACPSSFHACSVSACAAASAAASSAAKVAAKRSAALAASTRSVKLFRRGTCGEEGLLFTRLRVGADPRSKRPEPREEHEEAEEPRSKRPPTSIVGDVGAMAAGRGGRGASSSFTFIGGEYAVSSSSGLKGGRRGFFAGDAIAPGPGAADTTAGLPVSSL